MSSEQSSSLARAASRVNWIDTARGIGIILVVLGHVARSLVTSNLMRATPTVVYWDAWIYAFHMPLFFFLSGLFLVRAATKPVMEFIWDKVGSIAYPYFVWSTVTLAIKSLVGQHVNQPRTLLEWPEILIRPIEQYWFLYALFLLTIGFGFIVKLGGKTWLVLTIAAFLSPGLLPLPWSGWVPFDEARSFSIYLALGVVAGSFLLDLSETESKILTLGVIAGLCVVTWAAFFLPYAHPNSLNVIAALSGTAAVIAFAVLVSQTKVEPILGFLGRHSLEIFVAHSIASATVRIIFQLVFHITTPALYLFVGTLVGLLAPVFLGLGLRKVGVTWAFTLPKRNQSPSSREPNRTP